MEDAVHQTAQPLFGEFVSSHGGYRNIQRDAGAALANFAQQSSSGDHLAHRNSVQPNGARGRRLKGMGRAAQPFGQPASIPRIAQGAVNEIEY